MMERRHSELYTVSKAIATFYVVVGHAAIMYTPLGVYTPLRSSALMAMLCDFCYAFHMPLFFFLSGCVYGYCLESGKYRDIPAYIRTKAKRLLLPYFAVGACYVIPATVLLGITGDGYWAHLFPGLLTSDHSRHLWYLMALFLMYMLVIPLKWFPLNNAKRICLALLLSYLLKRDAWRLPAIFRIESAFLYLFYFILGIAFHHYYKELARVMEKGYLWIGIAALLSLLTMFPECMPKLPGVLYCVMGIVMTLALTWGLLTHFPSLTSAAWFQSVKRNAFAIYLFHPIVIYVFFSLLHPYDISPVILVVAVSIIATLLSIMLANVVRKLHLQVLIGE